MLMMFENRVLRRLFRPKRYEVTGEWRKRDNEELKELYSLTSIIRLIKSRRMTMAENVVCMWKRGSVDMILVGKPEENFLLS